MGFQNSKIASNFQKVVEILDSNTEESNSTRLSCRTSSSLSKCPVHNCRILYLIEYVCTSCALLEDLIIDTIL